MRLLAKDLRQCLKIHPVDMLRIERQPLGFQPSDKFRMGGTQPPNGGKQTQPAATSRDHQRRHGGRGCFGAFARHIVDNQDAGLPGVVKG